MFQYLNPKRFYHAVGRKKFFEFLILAVFLLFFYGPMMNLVMLAFANKYEVPAVIPQEFGFRWWGFVLSQKSLVSSIGLSFLFAIVTTIVSMLLCIPAAYAIARFKFPGRRIFMLSFLLTNAFPKIGLYTSIGILYYRYNLMGTFIGVVIIHLINTMMFMVWLPAGAFGNVHRQQEEAARDVGAGPFRTFMKVTFPMAMPGIAVASIYTFLGSMEEMQGTFLVGVPQYRTMPVEMYSVISDYPIMAGAVFAIILMIPTVILLVAMRKYIGPSAIAGGFKLK
ncbi:ABC transporter permease [Breznakiella homolactica]|uniref:ABC transporter permease subunit n=1 Tax=Breznakiella homolactica TaxID=2798577 RepID=A0A7T8BA95_9SPIR|nr:ABC transporter permease subunit [Breznakiella homolactica]QQO09141.1 ABC transporter permease subunit [Breznakiella homolactica]